jgi:hypothetical protein
MASSAYFVHKHSGWRYCVRCARKINAVCPEDPPFDWDRPVLP